MMQAGNMGGGNRGGGNTPSEKDESKLSVCDMSSDDFKKTWLKLKELHDQELHRIQAKLESLKKQQLADERWTGSTAKIEELTEQQKVLTGTIHDLQRQLNAKICNRCAMNEACEKTLQQEFYDIQQKNLKFIAELTAERNKLREENKELSARLKLNQQQFRSSFSDSDGDFFPPTQKTMSVFSVREPPQEIQVHLPIRGLKQSPTEQMESGEQKEQRQSSQVSIPLYSQDLFEVAETCLEKTSPCKSNKTFTGASANQKSGFLLTPTLGSQRENESQGVSYLPEDRLGQPKRKHISIQKISTPHRETQVDFSWSLSSISTRENLTTQVVSETSEENMPDCKKSLFPPFTQSKEMLPLNVFPFDYTLRSGKRRSTISVAGDNTGCLVRDGSNQTPSKEQSASSKNTNECTGAEYGAGKPQDDTQSVVSRSTIKRKARVQLGKRRM